MLSYELLEFVLDKNPIQIENIGTYLTDTVDAKIQEEVELTMDEIDKHPLMIETRKYLFEATK